MSIVERSKGSIRFALKDSYRSLRKTPNKESIINLNFAYGEKRFKYSTGYKTCLNDWDIQKERVRNKAHILNRGEINDYLNRLEVGLKRELTRLDSEGIPITMEGLKRKLDEITNKLDSQEVSKEVTFYEYFDLFLNRKKGKIKAVTLRSYKQTRRLLKEFDETLNFEDIDYDFHREFIRFLEEDDKSLNTISKHFKNLRVVLTAATRDGYNNNLIYTSSDFKVPTEQTTAIYLDEEEIERMKSLDLSGFPNLDRARDIFLIGCYTGQRVSDYNGLTKDNIYVKDDVRFFQIRQRKTGKVVLCPITKEIDAILNKLTNGGVPPQKMNEQDINEFIKQVGRKAGIDELINNEYTRGGKRVTEKLPKYQLIGTHTARRSFCTNKYKAGMPIYDIMHFSGHSTEKQFYNYIRIEKEQRAIHIAKSGYFNI